MTNWKFHLVTVRNTFIFVLCQQISSEYLSLFKRALGYILPLWTGCLPSVSCGHGEGFILANLKKSVGFGELLFFAVAAGLSRGLLLLQAPCVTVLSTGPVSQSWSCCCDNSGIVKPNLIRADRFMATAPVVASAAQLQWLPLHPSDWATAPLCCSVTKQCLVPLFVNLQKCLAEVLVFYKWRNRGPSDSRGHGLRQWHFNTGVSSPSLALSICDTLIYGNLIGNLLAGHLMWSLRISKSRGYFFMVMGRFPTDFCGLTLLSFIYSVIFLAFKSVIFHLPSGQKQTFSQDCEGSPSSLHCFSSASFNRIFSVLDFRSISGMHRHVCHLFCFSPVLNAGTSRLNNCCFNVLY